MQSKNRKIAFTLAMITGALCIGAFIYKYFGKNETDYVILLAGVFIVSISYAAYYMSGNE